jgi:hypothetical protein
MPTITPTTPNPAAAAVARKALIKAGMISMAREHRKRLDRYRQRPTQFANEVLHVKLAPYQADILHLLRDHGNVAVYGPRGMGKSFIASVALLWIMATAPNDTKAITTAGSWRQLTEFLWPEIRAVALRGEWGKIGYSIRDGHELNALQLKFADKHAFAAAATNSSLMEGAHASTMVGLFDEAKSIENPIWDSVEGSYSGAGKDTGLVAYRMAISTPGTQSGRFFDICSRKSGYERWAVRHVTIAEAVAARRVSQEWADQMLLAWGADSAQYKNHVLGEFADDADNVVIPLAWIRAAIERFAECKGKGGKGPPVYGLDPAYTGDDKTATARLVDDVCEWVKSTSQPDLMVTVGDMVYELDRSGGKNVSCGIDANGIGAGVFTRLRELGYHVFALNASSGTKLTDKSGQVGFINLRAAMWWGLREALDPANNPTLAIPDDPILTGDLAAPIWKRTSTGKVQIESKDDIRVRIGRSTDKADALCLALYVQHLRPAWEPRIF